jgi:hypothetical protein
MYSGSAARRGRHEAGIQGTPPLIFAIIRDGITFRMSAEIIHLVVTSIQARKLTTTRRPSSAPFPATSTRPGFAARPRPPSGQVRRLVSPESKLGGPPSARAPDTANSSAIE